MVEEALNFGMNATQLSKVSNLQSHVSELDYSIQKILNNLDSMQREQVAAVEKQEQTRQREEKKYQEISELRESVFNFKTGMEDIYQSNRFTIEEKYLQFRDACISSTIQTLNPNYFYTFEDKEYVISVKRYLSKTRDELFDNLDNNKQTIMKSIEDKENKLKEIINLNIKKPDFPSEPLFDKKHMRTLKRRPIKPIGYYKGFSKRQDKILNNLLFISFPLSILLTYAGCADLHSGLLRVILSFFIFPGVFLFFVALILYFKDIFKENNKKFHNYEKQVFASLEQTKWNKNIKQAHEYRLQAYRDNKETIMQNYQYGLKEYQDNQNNIKTLKQEIITLYQFFSN